MGTSAYEQYLAEQADPQSAYAQYLAEQNAPNAKKPLNKEQLARLAKGQQEKNAADTPSAYDRYVAPASEAFATFAAGIPGVRGAVSGIGSLLSGDTFANTQKEINNRTSDVPYASAAANAAGMLAVAPMLPASGMAAGAILGGADQALNNDPESGLASRAVRGLLGAIGGGIAGKYADRWVTAGRAVLSPTGDVARNRMLADRALEAKALFDRARDEGRGVLSMPKPVLDWLDSPDIAPIVSELKTTRPFANTPPDSPEMVDAVYKVLSDKGLIAKSKLAALVPRNANIGRVAAQDIGMAKQEGLDAISRGPNAPMPSYEDAVNSFRNNSRKIESFDTAFDAARATASGTVPSAKNLSRPDRMAGSFEDWLAGLSANTQDAAQAAKGALAYARTAKTGKGLDAAAKLLRVTDAAQGIMAPRVIQRGLLSVPLVSLPR